MNANPPRDHCGSTHLRTTVVRIPTSGGGIDPFEITFRNSNLCGDCFRTYQRQTLPGIIRLLEAQRHLDGEGDPETPLEE